MPLALMEVGKKARVLAVTGGDGVRKHLGSLGFIPGVVVDVVQVVAGSMILGIHDSRIAVNEDLTRRVLVEAA